jgi:hypothetical protein
MAIAGPIFVLCIVAVLVAFYIWHKKNNAKLLPPVKQPLMEKYPEVDSSGPCLKDMIDMTTSGSGSGKQSKCIPQRFHAFKLWK